MHKSNPSTKSDVLFPLYFLNLTDYTCIQLDLSFIPSMKFDWVCLMSKTNETDDESNGWVLFSCTSGILSHRCENHKYFSKALCDNELPQNSSLVCTEDSVTETLRTVCTRTVRFDVCQNSVETERLNKEGEFNNIPIDFLTR